MAKIGNSMKIQLTEFELWINAVRVDSSVLSFHCKIHCLQISQHPDKIEDETTLLEIRKGFRQFHHVPDHHLADQGFCPSIASRSGANGASRFCHDPSLVMFVLMMIVRYTQLYSFPYLHRKNLWAWSSDG